MNVTMSEKLYLMGDRFVVIRAGSNKARGKSATKAIGNTGHEIVMRQELAQAVGSIIGNASKDEYKFKPEETEQLVKAANIVTLARTAVERDYRGDVIDAHAPEMPTRFAKQLAQMVRGGVAIGMAVPDAMKLALRCARDSILPLRREILLDLAGPRTCASVSNARARGAAHAAVAALRRNRGNERGRQEAHQVFLWFCR
jgi:hypothetical protein